MENKNKTGVYILKSIKNNRYYVGSTNNIDRRYAQHCSGKVKSTTHIRPLTLCVFLPTTKLTEARQLEYKIKKQKSRKLLEKIISNKNFE